MKLLSLVLAAPGRVLALAAALSVGLILAVALPVVWPEARSVLPMPVIDTNPQNMLADDDPARVFDREASAHFGLEDRLILVVSNEQTAKGVFTPEALADIEALVAFTSALDGVDADGIDAISTLEDFEGVLMAELPTDGAAASALRDRVASNPLLSGRLVSHDGRRMTLSIPVAEDARDFRLARQIETFAAGLPAGNTVEITGQPIAQAAFGVEMFKQMAIAAPGAMAIIFLALFAIFRSWRIAVVPLVIAMVSTIGAMSALILTGNTVHIMSSMIPIFVMPIAVMDAIHILSDFADRRRPDVSTPETLSDVMAELKRPMLFTSITTAAGFASLVLAPIPPVQVFGLFVALGVLLAWFATVTMVPAMLMRMSQDMLSQIPRPGMHSGDTLIARIVRARPRTILAALGGLTLLAAAGLGNMRVNDNPMAWFTESHGIRQAERVVATEFNGAHPAYLAVSAEHGVLAEPDVVAWIAALETAIRRTPEVGGVTGFASILAEAERSAPGTTIPEILDGFRDGDRPQDLARFLDAASARAAIEITLLSGDNSNMKALSDAVDRFVLRTPPPTDLTLDWFGSASLNAVWQEKMVTGMLTALAGSVVMVGILMLMLLSHPGWALVSMVPLGVSVTAIYGLIGWMGRDFDMPITVLSALTLGLAVDFAIHFVTRFRQAQAEQGDPFAVTFGEPLRAILRNATVLGAGFMPLLLTPLVPYQTVGALIPAILVTAAIATILVIGAIIALRTEAPTAAEPAV